MCFFSTTYNKDSSKYDCTDKKEMSSGTIICFTPVHLTIMLALNCFLLDRNLYISCSREPCRSPPRSFGVMWRHLFCIVQHILSKETEANVDLLSSRNKESLLEMKLTI